MNSVENKKCTNCNIEKPLHDFWKAKNHKDGLRYICKDCERGRRIEYDKINRDKINITAKKWYWKNPIQRRKDRSNFYYENRDLLLNNMRTWYAKSKQEIFQAYGHKCDCCGESNKEFLCIDHINGGGCKHRKMGPAKVYTQIRKEGFPKDKYRLLCHNCNMSIGFYGYCPHKPEIVRPVIKKNQHTKL